MSLRLMLSAAAVLVLAVPAHAAVVQDAAPAEATAPLTEQDMEAASARFQVRMDALKAELDTLIAANKDNLDTLPAKIDEVTARYKPDFDAFSGLTDRYMASEIAKAETPEQREQLQGARDQVVPMLQSLPELIRTSAMQAATNPQ